MRPSAAVVQAREVHERIKADPVWFAENVLGHTLWETSKAILRAIAQPRARVAVKSCHASSKTFSAAELVLWAPFAGGIAITTAPTFPQVRRLVWAEVNGMYPLARARLGGELLQTEFRIAPDLYAIGRSTDQGVNFSGFHSRPGGFLLFVCDEAPGVTPGVMQAIEGARAGGDVRVLLIGNPDVPSGPFYDVFGEKSVGWTTFTIDGFDTPNLEDETRPGHHLTLDELLALPEERIGYAPWPFLIDRRYIREKYREWGPTNPLWQSKVRGQFPDQSSDSLLSIAWLEAAKHREVEPRPDDPWEAGLDVAGPGEDETVLYVRHGPSIIHFNAWPSTDPRGEVLADLLPFRDKLEAVKIDSIGQGYYFARHVEDNGYKGRVVDVNVGEAPRDRERFANLKAELYYGLMERFRDGDIGGLLDELTLSQLASIRHEPTPRGQTKIESKDDARKRGVKSPDRAEALMLCFASDVGGSLPLGWVTLAESLQQTFGDTPAQRALAAIAAGGFAECTREEYHGGVRKALQEQAAWAIDHGDTKTRMLALMEIQRLDAIHGARGIG